MERGISKKSHFLNNLALIASKIFGENDAEALVISKSLKFPLHDLTDTNFIAPLNMHFYRSKITLNSLKRFFNLFRRKPSLVAPDLT